MLSTKCLQDRIQLRKQHGSSLRDRRFDGFVGTCSGGAGRPSNPSVHVGQNDTLTLACKLFCNSCRSFSCFESGSEACVCQPPDDARVVLPSEYHDIVSSDALKFDFTNESLQFIDRIDNILFLKQKEASALLL